MEYRQQPDPSAPALQRFGRWMRLKQYQIEVTFGVYMFTPVEKFVFWSVVFLIFGLFFIATILYLPQHLAFILHRAWFYVSGGESSPAAALAGAVVSKDTAAVAAGAPPTASISGAHETAASLLRGEL